MSLAVRTTLRRLRWRRNKRVITDESVRGSRKQFKIRGARTYERHRKSQRRTISWRGTIASGGRVGGFLYWSDDGDLMALRVNQYKIVFAEQLATGLDVWREPLKQLRVPKMFDLRSDPFEAGDDSEKYTDWFIEHVPLQYGAQAIVHEWLESFKEFPPRQKAASFTVDQIIESLMPKS